MSTDNIKIKKVSKYLARKYPRLAATKTSECIELMVAMFWNRLMYEENEDGDIIGATIYVNINEEAADAISKKHIDPDTEEGLTRLLNMPGDIFYIFCVATDDNSLMWKGFRRLMKERKPSGILIRRRKDLKTFLHRRKPDGD
jgi:hypothetical protein